MITVYRRIDNDSNYWQWIIVNIENSTQDGIFYRDDLNIRLGDSARDLVSSFNDEFTNDENVYYIFAKYNNLNDFNTLMKQEYPEEFI